MKRYDLLILGPATRDVNIDYTGRAESSVGGAVTFCTPAAVAAGAKVFAAVKIAEADADVMDCIAVPEADKALLPSSWTTLMRNEYFTADRERRNSSCAAQSDPILPDELPEISYELCHLAGLLYGDFPPELIEALHVRGRLSADAQGFLRRSEGGSMSLYDWPEKRRFLPYMDFFKTDAAEAETLTGLSDREAAARLLCEWGAKEVMVSHNSEMLVCDGEKVYACPVRARGLSGRTGRGDTTFGSYLAMRVTGHGAEESLLYATACVSLKMETPGPFRGSRADVEEFIRAYYPEAGCR